MENKISIVILSKVRPFFQQIVGNVIKAERNLEKHEIAMTS